MIKALVSTAKKGAACVRQVCANLEDMERITDDLNTKACDITKSLQVNGMPMDALRSQIVFKKSHA